LERSTENTRSNGCNQEAAVLSKCLYVPAPIVYGISDRHPDRAHKSVAVLSAVVYDRHCAVNNYSSRIGLAIARQPHRIGLAVARVDNQEAAIAYDQIVTTAQDYDQTLL
jgi:hypothetical protein